MQTYNLQEFRQAARGFALGLTHFSDRATVVGLYGDLGAGKTTFVQVAAKVLGITETVNSPTFLIFKKYPLLVTSSRYSFLVHIDAYRLKHSDELRRLRFAELLADPHNLIFVEWADRVADILPPNHRKIFFEFVDEDTRSVTIT
jgi:tRNA threonylcarbamoyladenosine biosynthesis protein TsaE